MTTILDILRQAISGFNAALNMLPVELALMLNALISSVVMLLVFRAVTPAHWMKKPRDRMTAAIYEMRLYLDNPRRVIRAQADLIRYSLTYTAAMFPAIIILTVPFALLLLDLEAEWGFEPLDVSEAITMRVDLDAGVESFEAKPSDCAELSGALHFPEENVAYARYQMSEAVDCTVTVVVDGNDVTKRLDAGSGSESLNRLRGLDLLVHVTDEPALGDGVARISVHHEPAQFHHFGLTWPWWVHWLWMVFLFSGFLIKPLNVTL